MVIVYGRYKRRDGRGNRALLVGRVNRIALFSRNDPPDAAPWVLHVVRGAGYEVKVDVKYRLPGGRPLVYADGIPHGSETGVQVILRLVKDLKHCGLFFFIQRKPARLVPGGDDEDVSRSDRVFIEAGEAAR